jgi:hypothetical protein
VRLARLPWRWLVPLAAAAPICVLDSRPDQFQADLPYFTRIGVRMLSPDWHATFTSAKLQAGPLQLLVFGGAGRLAAWLGVSPAVLLAPLTELGITALYVFAVGRVLPEGRWRPWALVAVPTVFVLLANPSTVYLAGHPADAITPVLWLLAASESRRGRVGRAALLLALGANLEVWSVLGVPVLLLAPRLRDAVRGGVLTALAAAAPFLPFALAAPFRMFAFHWQVSGNSLIGLVLEPGTAFPWTLRLAQGAIALGAGAAVARLAFRRPVAVCLAPAAIVTARLLLDPISGASYYSVALSLLALVAIPFAADYVAELLHPAAEAAEGSA